MRRTVLPVEHSFSCCCCCYLAARLIFSRIAKFKVVGPRSSLVQGSSTSRPRVNTACFWHHRSAADDLKTFGAVREVAKTRRQGEETGRGTRRVDVNRRAVYSYRWSPGVHKTVRQLRTFACKQQGHPLSSADRDFVPHLTLAASTAKNVKQRDGVCPPVCMSHLFFLTLMRL